MHTCAQEPDLFGAPPSQSEQVDALIVITGTLADKAEVRVRAMGAHAIPVLCVNLLHVGPADHKVHVEQPYPQDQRHQAEALAAQLHKGMQVSVTAPLRGALLSLPAAQSIAPITHITRSTPIQTTAATAAH